MIALYYKSSTYINIFYPLRWMLMVLFVTWLWVRYWYWCKCYVLTQIFAGFLLCVDIVIIIIAFDSGTLFKTLIQSCFMQLEVLFKGSSYLTGAEEESCLCLCVYVQQSVEMRKMETTVSSAITVLDSCLENQGRAASMPRLNAEMQVEWWVH